jgi:hypothetical protein
VRFVRRSWCAEKNAELRLDRELFGKGSMMRRHHSME